MVFVTVIIMAFIASITVIPHFERTDSAKNFLSILAENNGARPGPAFTPVRPGGKPGDSNIPKKNDSRNMFDNANIATAYFDHNGVLLQWFSDRQDLFDEEYVLTAAAQVVKNNKEFGVIDNQYFILKQKPDGYLVILMDNAVNFANEKSTFLIVCIASVGIWVAFLILTVWLVDRMIAPVQDAFSRQRQFISDAGHELKTPISVIGANANVLQSEIGENKWLGYITDETRRMENLVKSLMVLTSMENAADNNSHYRFDFSKAVMSIALPFESLAFEKGIIIDFAVEDNLVFSGNEEKLKQVVSILLNNAVKYGEENGKIKVALQRERKKIILSVYNTGQGIKSDELALVFERFYRADKARTREGQSYGLGLAIAKAAVLEHGGSIYADSEFGKWVKFTAEFPVKHQTLN